MKYFIVHLYRVHQRYTTRFFAGLS